MDKDCIVELVQGAYYATVEYKNLHFTYFYEEENLNLKTMPIELNKDAEIAVLKDNNAKVLKYKSELQINKHYYTTTNRLLTSLLSKVWLTFVLENPIAYVEDDDKKHFFVQDCQTSL